MFMKPNISKINSVLRFGAHDNDSESKQNSHIFNIHTQIGLIHGPVRLKPKPDMTAPS